MKRNKHLIDSRRFAFQGHSFQRRMLIIRVQFWGSYDFLASQAPPASAIPVLDLSSERETTDQTDVFASKYKASSASSDGI